MTITDAPPGYAPLENDVSWDPGYLELVPPERVFMLDEFGPDAAGPTALSPVAITTPFRFLSDEGIRVMHAVCSELEGFAGANNRIAKCARGGVYRSAFLRGMSADPDLLEFLGGLAQAPIEPHPVGHHAMHVNYAPDELGKNVDQWHCDVVSFDYVLMVWDPRPLKGGRFEYFRGPVEEGRDLLVEGAGLPPERVVSVEFPGPGGPSCSRATGCSIVPPGSRNGESGSPPLPRSTRPIQRSPTPPIFRRFVPRTGMTSRWSSGAVTHPWSPRGGSSTLPKRARPSRARGKSSKRRCGRASPWSRMRSRSSTGRNRGR